MKLSSAQCLHIITSCLLIFLTSCRYTSHISSKLVIIVAWCILVTSGRSSLRMILVAWLRQYSSQLINALDIVKLASYIIIICDWIAWMLCWQRCTSKLTSVASHLLQRQPMFIHHNIQACRCKIHYCVVFNIVHCPSYSCMMSMTKIPLFLAYCTFLPIITLF